MVRINQSNRYWKQVRQRTIDELRKVQEDSLEYLKSKSYDLIFNSRIIRLDKKLFDGFPMLKKLEIATNHELKTIEIDAFSNLKNLKKLKLHYNQNLSELDPELFSCLANFEEFDLSYNKLRHFNLKIIDYIVKIKEIHLYGNWFKNKEEILDYFEQSKIKCNVYI